MTLVGPADGGVSHVSRMLARHWPVHGVVETVLVSDDALTVETTCACGPLEGAPRSSIVRRAVRAAWFHRRCLRASTSLHVELGRTSVGALWFALAASALLRRRVVLGAHDLPVVVNNPAAGLVRQGHGWRDRIAYRVVAPVLDRPVIAFLRRRTAATVVLSAAAAASAATAGWPKVTLASHGASARTSRTGPSAGTYVLLAGYLGPGKGLDVLAEAWQQLSSPLPLVVAGGFGDQDSAWVGRVRARFDAGTNPPTWTGYVDDERFDELIRDAAVVVLPYEQSNPASGVLVRALIEGRAVVATRVPAVLGEVDDDVNGVLVDPGDPAQLAEALTRVLSSAELRDRLGDAAASVAAARHSWSSHARVAAEAQESASATAARGPRTLWWPRRAS